MSFNKDQQISRDRDVIGMPRSCCWSDMAGLAQLRDVSVSAYQCVFGMRVPVQTVGVAGVCFGKNRDLI